MNMPPYRHQLLSVHYSVGINGSQRVYFEPEICNFQPR